MRKVLTILAFALSSTPFLHASISLLLIPISASADLICNKAMHKGNGDDRRIIPTLDWTNWKMENNGVVGISYPFTGERNYSQSYTISMAATTISAAHSLNIYIPVWRGSTDTEIYSTLVREAIRSLPLEWLVILKTVRLNDVNYRAGPNGLHPHGVASMGAIDIFPAGFNSLKDWGFGGDGTNLIRHEFAHLVAQNAFRSPIPPESYRLAVVADGNQVSEYGSTSLDEDWAEAYMHYLYTDAGRYFPDARKKFPNRFAYFDGFNEFAGKDPVQPMDLILK